jgi:hypothetical protein
MPDKFDNTQEWNEKTIGETYNNTIDYYNKTDLDWRMYNGDQWAGIKASELPKFQLNICKQSMDFLIASIMSRPIKAEYSADNIPEPLPPQEGEILSPEDEINREIRSKITTLNNYAEMKWEKNKMDFMLNRLLLDAACSGDMAAHEYWNASVKTGQDETGDFCTERVDGANIMLGDPNIHDVEKQPYILLIGRDTVKNLKREAKKNGVGGKDIEKILPDTDTTYQVGDYGNIELEGGTDENKKATYVIKYWRDEETGNIFWNKSTKHCPIRTSVDLGISRYPIVFGNWSEIKNSYHGNPPIYEIIPNQLVINQLFAMVAYWARMSAFGKVIVDSSRIPQGRWSNKIGEAIYADGNVNDIVKQIEAGQFNSAILEIIDMATKYTKDFLGANEAALGQINPERASGTAIMLTAKQAAIPHANVLANLQQFVEDLYLVWGEFFLKKYKNRTLYFKADNEKMVGEQYSSGGMEDVLLSCKVNVGQSTIWNEPILLQNLDNLAKMGWISEVDYYERIKTMNILPDVQGLIAKAKLKEMIEAQKQQAIEQMQSQLGMIPGLPKSEQPQGMNDPKLQGNMGQTAQNSFRASQPSQGG